MPATSHGFWLVNNRRRAGLENISIRSACHAETTMLPYRMETGRNISILLRAEPSESKIETVLNELWH